MNEGFLQIKTNGSMSTKSWQVFLDGKEISKYIRGVFLYASVNALPVVSLEFVAKLDIPDEIQALITAYKDDEKDGENIS